jgi:hypothetical protein
LEQRSSAVRLCEQIAPSVSSHKDPGQPATWPGFFV